MNEEDTIKNLMFNKETREFIFSNLRKSLKDIGFSSEFIEDLIKTLNDFDVKKFQRKHKEELEKIYKVGFFQRLVPSYFGKYVIPKIPKSKTIVDIGCGTGILAKKLSESGSFDKIIGIDLNKYQEWDKFKSSKIDFKIIKEKDFSEFLKDTQPDQVVLTWTLHHMEYDEQERYMKEIYTNLSKGSKIIILEDSYSEKMKPENGEQKCENFMKFKAEERRKIMSVYDWIANRILAVRNNVNIPFSYRTLEGWESLFKSIGYNINFKEFIGFPNKRDINTPQSLIVIEK